MDVSTDMCVLVGPGGTAATLQTANVGHDRAISSLPHGKCLRFSPTRDFIRLQRREIKPFWDIYEWIVARPGEQRRRD